MDDRRVLSGFVYVIRNGFSGKTLRKRMVRTRLYTTALSAGAAWVSLTVMEEAGRSKRLMVDATHLKVHRTSVSLLKKGLFSAISDGQKAA
ncbi:MAG: hypothetical protein SOH81_09545 [Acetobacter sp.]|jgi:hypothetical protein